MFDHQTCNVKKMNEGCCLNILRQWHGLLVSKCILQVSTMPVLSCVAGKALLTP